MTVDERFHGDLPFETAEAAAERVPTGAVVATSGFGSVGYPKAVPETIAAADGERELTVLTGGSVGEEIDTALVESGDMARRFPYLGTPAVREAANDGRVAFHDRHVSRLGDEVQYGGLADVDVALVEAVAVGEDWLIPSPSIGQSPAFVAAADELIVEVNRQQPLALQRLHDVYRPGAPPDRDPIPLTEPGGRIGDARIGFDAGKLVAVVETDRRDSTYDFREPTDVDRAIAANFGDWLAGEVERNPTMAESVRLQFGVGAIGNALMGALGDADLGDRDLVYFGEVFQDGLLDLVDDGTLASTSATTLALTRDGQDRLFEDVERYADSVVLRPVDVTNAAELVERFGVVAVNSALEVDLYGHVNSTHVDGTHALNGLGGSGDFNRAGLVTVVALPSTAGGGDLSRIVPMVPHVDHTEHDVDAVVTEHGVADLRGLAPRERAERIVEVAHPEYRSALAAYRERADEYGGHVPHDLETALEWPRDRQRE
ncbi:acetyl-CoA hydrolase [Natronomonas salina]|uniref:acetyl-CoA hydrolase/transferase C-terminal domain-containing protein n=1 Tax=Natronomonas salina TaxID=1710540 RepID=UPI0015B5F834|nr:acetyl-CoA hydrolase/transferase C-terminal domain-containing protein [Natronomonas salina]QLD90032.1 acetyl-CoA hydrolase [Natronomonas salina]